MWEVRPFSMILLQVLTGDAPIDLMINSGHCHYGLVAALFILGRHERSQETALNYLFTAMQLLGGFSALDFLEDSAWPISSLVPRWG